MIQTEKNCRGALEQSAQCIVVKVGSRILTRDGRVDLGQIRTLTQQLASLTDQGRRVCLVSSGAVGTAMTLLNTDRPDNLGQLQAYAAIGQAELIHHYNRELEAFQKKAAQVLLTSEDMNHRRRYLNLRNTIFSLFELGAIPIINENDCVATDEIAVTFGDNDRLAANVAMLVDADLLVILSDVKSLHDRHPREPEAKPIGFVEQIDDKLLEMAGRSSTTTSTSQPPSELQRDFSKGGMLSKLQAARMAASVGIPAVIAGGRVPHVLESIVSGQPVGTFVSAASPLVPNRRRTNSRKRWIKSSTDIPGKIVIDPGAALAICQQGRSLLPIGVTEVQGNFEAGDVIQIIDQQGKTIGKGISNFSDQEARRIHLCRTAEIIDKLGRIANEEMVHRDNLALE